MFEQDYLMRMILQLVDAIRRSMEAARGDDGDPEAAAALLEAAISDATELDGDVLLSLSPESIATVLDVSGTDPGVAEYVGRSMFLEADYLRECGNDDTARLRVAQAQALAQAYGFDLDETMGGQAAMEAFLAAESAKEEDECATMDEE